MMEIFDVDICICTFRRPQIKDTLASIAALDIPDFVRIRIIVADNDDTDLARVAIEGCARNLNLALLYIHAPARNISLARNACLDHVSAPYVAFIDDDETATPEWLSALLFRREETQAEIILGPVKALYNKNAPDWMRREDFHSITPVWVDGEIITGYTSNVLLDCRNTCIKTARFDEKFGKSGGEDTRFFTLLHRQGCKIQYAPQALVMEIVLPERANIFWLLQRRFRMGQTHAQDLVQQDKRRMRHFIVATAKVFFCISGALIHPFDRGRRSFWILRAALHIGVISRLLGTNTLSLYGGEQGRANT